MSLEAAFARDLVAVLFVTFTFGGCALWLIIATIAENWRKARSAEHHAVLKQKMIDAGYRDELKVLLVNTDPDADYEVQRGDRIAQLVIQQVAHVEFTTVDELPASERGTGGFGHSGR